MKIKIQYRCLTLRTDRMIIAEFMAIVTTNYLYDYWAISLSSIQDKAS